jgi:trehalose 2-sulfotransferase
VAPPRSSYLVCANQRSGTTLLCRALTDTGIAGRPEEYFLAVDEVEQPGWRVWEEGFFGNSAVDREDYLRIVFELGSTANGVFGAKLMWNNVRWALDKFRELPRFAGLDRAAVFRTAFPDLHVVNVTRRDRVRQAVSWARAAQEGVWVTSADEPPVPTGRPEYDFELIGNLVGLIEEGERGWRELYAELGLTPCEVVYEDLVTDDGYERAVRAVLEHLGLELGDITMPRPRAHRQSDALNDEWVTRYNEEARPRR